MTQRSKYADPAAKRYLAYRNEVAMAALQIRGRPLSWPHIRAEITVYLYSKSGPLKGKRGDADNLAKAVVDGLQHGGVFLNDRCVTALLVLLRPCESPAEERVEVKLTEDDISLLAQ
jgi:Holliday junction resolvase RusA-like endonuclease